MTDNQTTELREKLTERGVKWIAYEKECKLTLEGFFDTRWDANGVRWSYLEINGKATLSVVGRMEVDFTPEQAIAATLGSEYHGYEQAAIEAWESIKAWNTRATHGTLTAEQVSKATYAHSIHADCADADWQAIVDELHGELGSGTCEFVVKDNMNESEGMGDVWIECSACHCQFDYYADDWLMKMSYCPNCGRQVAR